MKMTSMQLAAVKRQTGADPIEEGSEAHGALAEAFGDHTFYVSEVGLLVPEPAEGAMPANDGEAPPADPVELILVAQWTDEKREAMQRIEPQHTGYILDAAAVDGPAVADQTEGEA